MGGGGVYFFILFFILFFGEGGESREGLLRSRGEGVWGASCIPFFFEAVKFRSVGRWPSRFFFFREGWTRLIRDITCDGGGFFFLLGVLGLS